MKLLHPLRRLLAISVLMLPLIACAEQSNKIAFKPLKSGNALALVVAEPTVLVFNNQQDWEAFWQKQENGDTAPQGDFSREMFLAVVDSTQPNGGYGITINTIEEKNGQLFVQGVRTKPGDNCITTMMMSQPYAIVNLAKSSATPTLVLTTEEKGC